MTFSFNFADLESTTPRSAAVAPLPFGATPSGSLTEGARSYPRPWEGLALTLHRVLNCGAKDGAAPLAIQLFEAERAARTLMMLVTVGVLTYLAMWGYALDVGINLSKDWFAAVILGIWYLALFTLLISQLFGRYRPLPDSLSDEEIRDRPEFHLPALFFSHELFNTRSWEGYLAAFIVSFVHVAVFMGTVVLLYACAARMLDHHAYATVYNIIWSALLGQTVLTAFARSVSFGDLKSRANKASTPATQIEQWRVNLVTLYIFLAVSVVLPLGAVFVGYAGV